MVAAWISAETGVGPAMASGSQTYRGSWADLPATPNSMNTVIAKITAGHYRGNLRRLFEHHMEGEGPEGPEHGEACQQEAKVADAVGDEGFLGCQ